MLLDFYKYVMQVNCVFTFLIFLKSYTITDLQVLIDKGISVDEIRLYGESENDDALDDSLNDDNFSELEAVISKVSCILLK